MNQKTAPITLCISSGKGGVGKTSLAVNLAYALVALGKKILVVDGDLGLANTDILLGLSVKKTMRDVLENWVDPLKSIVYPEPNLGVLPGSSGVPEMVSLGQEEQKQLGECLESIVRDFDITIIDTAAGIGSSVLWFNTFVNHNIIVLDPDPTSLTDAYALMKILAKKYGRERIYLVFNLIGNEQEGRQNYERMQRVARTFLNLDLLYLGAIPPDKAVRDAVREQKPFVLTRPQCPASVAVTAIARHVLSMS